MKERKSIKNKSDSWQKISDELEIETHDYEKGPFKLTAIDIKKITSKFGISNNSLTEPRILCKQDSREDRPEVFSKNNLFILPIKNGEYAILRGEGYIDIPKIESEPIEYTDKLGFELETSKFISP